MQSIVARNQLAQRQRTAQDPLLIGSFSETSIRYLQGSLGPKSQVVVGGYGGGTYNNWFKIILEAPSWLIIAKGPPRPQYIQVSPYDLNQNPIEGRSIFQADSIRVNDEGAFYPYLGHVMAASSDTYNFFDPTRLDKGDERYYPLEVGEYLLCVSSTRNEPLDYAVAVVIEVASSTPLMLLEDYSRLLFEDTVDQSSILFDTPPGYNGQQDHEHSLTEWKEAWRRERQDYAPFPEILVPYATKP